VVFAADGDIPLALEVVRTARETPTVAIVASAARPSIIAPAEAAGVEVIRSADLLSALGTLRKRGVGSLLVEGGGRLAGALLAAGLVDRYYWVQSPLWLGMGAVPAIAGLPGSALGEARRWSVSERRALGEDTLLVLDRV
jgi:diaminohydroxyphosphoribosylaminopyrimidine deaminase/5-amino-6-(5-phosphoribosylamino)uracil reductase